MHLRCYLTVTTTTFMPFTATPRTAIWTSYAVFRSPLRTDADLDAAIAVIDSLLDRPKLSTAEQDYLDVLSDLVEAYEAETVPMRPVGDAELLRS